MEKMKGPSGIRRTLSINLIGWCYHSSASAAEIIKLKGPFSTYQQQAWSSGRQICLRDGKIEVQS